MLDHRLVELAATLPRALKVQGGKQKWILEQILYRYVPEQLVDRPKMGFAVPMATWIRGPLEGLGAGHPVAGDSLRDGFVDPAQVSRLLADHLAGTEDADARLWNVLVFQAWVAGQRASPA